MTARTRRQARAARKVERPGCPLGQRGKGLLIGEQADPRLVAALREAAAEEPGVRRTTRLLTVQLSPDQVEPGITRLADDLASGRWHERYGDLLQRDELDLGYRLVTAGRQS